MPAGLGVAAFLFRALMKLKILLTLCGFLPFLGGCTAEQVADFKEGMRRGAEFRNEILTGAANGLGAYARGYSQTYQSYPVPAYVAPQENAFSEGLHFYNPPVGQGLGHPYSVMNGDIWEY
jgi:hypothetical protein